MDQWNDKTEKTPEKMVKTKHSNKKQKGIEIDVVVSSSVEMSMIRLKRLYFV